VARQEMAALTFRDLIKRLTDDGWFLERTSGSHQHYRHPTRPGTITVPAGGKMGRDVPAGTLNSILRQAGLK
jgi:predicted RNA binding protein YcfA (HicA-like mRNA interferase family)